MAEKKVRKPAKRGTPKKQPAPKPTHATPAKVVSEAMLAPRLPTGRGPADLEAQILEHPNDLDSRRVLSDVLIENGDPRGEYLRLSLLLDELAPYDERYRAVERAVKALEARHNATWSAEARQVPELNVVEPKWGNTPFRFCRGAVEDLQGHCKQLVGLIPKARKVMPLCGLEVHLDDATNKDLERLGELEALTDVRKLTLRLGFGKNMNAGLRAFFASPHLVKLDQLSINGEMTEEVAALLANTKSLESLTALQLNNAGKGFGVDGLRHLLNSKVVHGLRRLALDRQGLRAEGAKLLAGLEGLDSLRVSQDDIGLRGAQALSSSSALASLRHLDLSSVPLGEKGAGAVVSGSAFRQLRVLCLQGVKVNGKGLRSVLEAFDLPELRELDLSGNPLRTEGAELLASTRALEHIESLDLGGTALKDDGAKALARASQWSHLERLHLDGNQLMSDGLGALAEGNLLSTVRDISLRNNKCQNAGGEALARWPSLAQVRRLSLYYNWMGVKGVRAILERMEAAEELSLDENNYGEEPARAVAKSPSIRNLFAFSLRGISAEWMAKLAQSDSAQSLESLGLAGCSIDQKAAQALCELPCLGQVRLNFCTLDETARGLMRNRFGPFLTLWPPPR